MATNYALSSNGCTATASVAGVGGTAAATNNGSRHTGAWPASGFDSGIFPATFTYDFGTSRSVSEVDVFTLADAVDYNTDPILSDTFSLFGITAYTVEYWNGSAWTTLVAAVSGNNKVWRQHSFAAVATTKLRLVVTAGLANSARLVEFEAWALPPTITTTSPLASVFLGGTFSGTFATSGGAGPMTWTHGTGLPPGMSISSAGVMSGTATTPGTYTFDVTATDTQGLPDTKSFTITVHPPSHGKATVTVSVLGTVSGEVA